MPSCSSGPIPSREDARKTRGAQVRAAFATDRLTRAGQEIPQTGYRPGSHNTTPRNRERALESWAGQKALEPPIDRSDPQTERPDAAAANFPAEWCKCKPARTQLGRWRQTEPRWH